MLVLFRVTCRLSICGCRYSFRGATGNEGKIGHQAVADQRRDVSVVTLAKIYSRKSISVVIGCKLLLLSAVRSVVHAFYLFGNYRDVS